MSHSLTRDHLIRPLPPTPWLLVIAMAAGALSSPLSFPAQSPRAGYGHDVGNSDSVRIESELKLSVPEDETEAVWDYLTTRYLPASSLLRELDPAFSTQFSTEYFEDRYFDSPDLQMLGRQGGIRHRTRRIPDDPDHPKHGRQLVQIKLGRAEDQQNIARTEIKFSTRTPSLSRNPLDNHPLLGVIDRDERGEFIRSVVELGLEPMDLEEVFTIRQRLRRIYIARGGEAFSTITLDEVSARKWWEEVNFVEVEMELNEIGFTEATPEQRARMERINEAIKRDLRAEFPEIVQNQTPKYNKVFDRFDARYLSFPTALKLGAPTEATLAGSGLILLLAAGGIVVGRLRRRRDHTE